MSRTLVEYSSPDSYEVRQGKKDALTVAMHVQCLVIIVGSQTLVMFP